MKVNEKILKEGNKLIAEYYGDVKVFDYHTDYNLILKIVHKIECDTGYGLIIYPDYSFWNNGGQCPFKEESYGITRLMAIWDAVVVMIKYLNENSTN